MCRLQIIGNECQNDKHKEIFIYFVMLQPKPMPRPPPSSVPKERPTLYRTTLLRKNKAKAEPASEGVRWSLPDQKKENFQVYI